MQNQRMLTWIIVIVLIALGVYWYRNHNVTEYKVVVKEKVTENVQ